METLVTVSGLSKTYETPAGGLQVLKGIDMDIGAGEMVGIVGASGAGKSTLLHILGTLDVPTQGSVGYHLGGEPVDPFRLDNGDIAAFRNGVMGFVFQFHYLLPEFSALENVMMPGLINRELSGPGRSRFGNRGLRDVKDIRERAESLLATMGLGDRKGHKPGELSGGEQQRVAVARALVLEPRIVFADEPTGNLDTTTGEGLFRQFMDINGKQGITFVIVTHNESLSRRCHRVVEMVDGRMLNR
jgi:lipoprotein-releasing system ATP-binding protein